MQYLLGIASLFFACFVIAQNKVNLSINPSTAEVGETFEISVTSSEVGTIDFGDMPDEFLQDYAVQQGSAQHQAPNGKVTVQHYYTISGIIKKPGNYTFGPITLTRGNQTYVSNTAIINISPKVKMRGSHVSSRQLRDPAFGTIEVNKMKLYEGEPLLVRAKLYARYKPTHVNNYVAYEMDGALIKHPLGNNSQLKPIIEQFHGENIYTIDYDKNILFPTAVGKVKIEPYKMNLHQGYQSFPLISSGLTVNILPLPANPPKDFIGAVGDFSVSRELPETSFNQGDVIKMIVSVEGIGNLHNITPPQLNLPKGFTIYGDPVITEEYSFGVHGSEGHISYEYNIEVTASGATSLPPTTITFFDPDQEKYITTETSDDSLSIKPGVGFDENDAEDDNDKRTNELIVQEFSPRDNSGSVYPGTIFGSGIFWGGVTFPLATAFLFLLFVKNKRSSEQRRIEKQRKTAQSVALSEKLQAVRESVNSADKSEFYNALDKALRGVFAVAIQKENQVVSKKEILTYAESVSETLREKTSALFSSAEISKFSFGSDNDMRNEDLKAMEEIVTALKLKK